MDKEQRKFLLKVKKAGLLNRSDVLPQEKEILRYHIKNRYIAPRGFPNETEQYLEVTQSGLNELYGISQTTFRFWFPIVLSNVIAVAALIISIIALLKQ